MAFFDPIPIERVVSIDPFVIQRRIAFRDCDPAGVVYTPRFLDPIATSAVDLFVQALIGRPTDRVAPFDKIGFPAKAVEIVFHHPTRLDELVDIKLSIKTIRKRTFTVLASAYNQTNDHLFDAALTLIAIAKGEWRSVDLPSELLQRLAPYHADPS